MKASHDSRLCIPTASELEYYLYNSYDTTAPKDWDKQLPIDWWYLTYKHKEEVNKPFLNAFLTLIILLVAAWLGMNLHW